MKFIPKDQLEGEILECYNYFNDLILNKVNFNFWIAGGAIRKFLNKEHYLDSDIDIYTPNDYCMQGLNKYLYCNNFQVTFENENTVRYTLDDVSFDIIKIHFNSPELTIDNFDFTVCCAAIFHDGFCCHDNYFEHLKEKRIVINKPSNYCVLLDRFQKYITKGYLALPVDLDEIHNYIRQSPPVNRAGKQNILSTAKISYKPYIQNITWNDNQVTFKSGTIMNSF